MPKITVTDHQNKSRDVIVKDGVTLKDGLKAAGVNDILAECGGACACATCHVFVDEGWFDLVGPPGGMEDDMLDFTEIDRRETSRLSCQIPISNELDGLQVTLPERQN